MKKLYVASSWKNEFYKDLTTRLQLHDYRVWDWRNPPTGGNGFSWKQIALDYNNEPIELGRLMDILDHPIAQSGFASDLAGMIWCDECVLCLPAGSSAHMEAGYIKGIGKKVHVYRPTAQEPDLMHLLFDGFYETFEELLEPLSR
jgi:hypothetical protein